MAQRDSRPTRPDGKVSQARIRALAQKIGRHFKPEKIVLFGSYAYGRPTADSDVDLLVVLRTRRDVADVASQIACSVNPEFPLEILVKTPAEIRWRLAERDCFLTEILARGR